MTKEEVKKLRKRLMMNTREFGNAVGVSSRTVEDWEQGRYRPSGSARKLMKMLMEKKNESAG